MSKKITLEEAQRRIEKKFGKGKIFMIPESYFGVTKIATFQCIIDGHDDWDDTLDNTIHSKHGCTKCANASVSKGRIISIEDVQKKIIARFGEDKVFIIPESYSSATELATFRCHNPDHEDWDNYPKSVYGKKGNGCHECSKEELSKRFAKDIDEIQPAIDLKHGSNRITMIPETYITVHKLATFQCYNQEHKNWETTPSNVYANGTGCPACAQYGFDPSKPAIVYYFQDIITGEYKLGITNKEIYQRFSAMYRKRMRLIKVWKFTSGAEAKKFETEIHKMYDFYRTVNEGWGSLSDRYNGSTEFFYDDILNLDNNPLPIFGLNTLPLK